MTTQELIKKIEVMIVPPFPIEDENNEILVALQEGAQLGYKKAKTDILYVLKEAIKK